MMNEARQAFEAFMRSKNRNLKWDGEKYNTPNLQTKWRYFLIGWMQREAQDAMIAGWLENLEKKNGA